MNRLDRLLEAKKSLEVFHAKYPEAVVVASMQSQLDYLIAIEQGSIQDRSRLCDIILGVQTAREIEPRDEDTATMLYELVDIVEEMKKDGH